MKLQTTKVTTTATTATRLKLDTTRTILATSTVFLPEEASRAVILTTFPHLSNRITHDMSIVMALNSNY